MNDVSRIKTRDRVLVDPQVQNPVDRYQLRARRRNLAILVIVVLLVIVIRRWLI
jgi:hypothetical protein